MSVVESLARRGFLALALLSCCAAVASAADPQIEAALLEVEGEAVKLNKGSEAGVALDQVFDLYQEAPP